MRRPSKIIRDGSADAVRGGGPANNWDGRGREGREEKQTKNYFTRRKPKEVNRENVKNPRHRKRGYLN